MDDDFNIFTLKGLQNIAKRRGLKGYSRLRRAELIELLRNQRPILDIGNIRQPDNEFRRLTVKSLHNIAKSRGMRGYSRLSKDQLITRLSNQESPILDRDIGTISAPILTPTPYVPLPPVTPATPPVVTVEEILKSLESVKKVPKSISPELKALKEKINKIHRRQDQIDIRLVSSAHDQQVRKYRGDGMPYKGDGKSVSSPKEFLQLAKENAIKNLLVNRERKVKMNIECYMYYHQRSPEDAVPARFHSDVNEINLKETDVYELYDRMAARILENIATFQAKESGWIFRNVSEIVLITAVYDPLKAGGYIPLPKWIRNKKVVINMKNEDDKCFLWCILRWLNPVNRHAYRVDEVLKEKENSLKV